MTVITKPLSDKKEKNAEPILDEFKVGIMPARGSCSGSIESGHGSGSGLLVQEKRASSATTACLFFTALLVMSCGIITGVCLYHQFARAQKHRFHSWCTIPVYEESRLASMLQELPLREYLNNDYPVFNKLNQKGVESSNLLKEEFEIEDNYEKISVPYFGNARRSKFIHDFKANFTGIVAVEDKRCFVMPLNRSLVVPPKDLIDLIDKLRKRYYDIDTTFLRETMRVVTPEIEDRSDLGSYIQEECARYPIYKLEKYVSGVFKRSAGKEYKFVEFAGKNTHELNIVNLAELEEHEAQRPVAMA